MPKTKKVGSTRKRRKYPVEKLIAAVKDMLNEDRTTQQAHRLYHVPERTLTRNYKQVINYFH